MLRLKAVVLGFTGALVFAAGAQAADPAWRPSPLDAAVLRGSAYDGEPVAKPPRFMPEWPVYRRWGGFYVGGQIGANSVNADFSNATKSQISYILANTELQSEVSGWQTLPKASTSGMSFGGFVGYNVQWADAITGVELNYHHVGLDLSVRDTIGPIIVQGASLADGSTVQYAVAVTSHAAVSIHDIMTARARLGWAANRFLPYAFVGAAVGLADTVRFTDVGGTKTVTPPPTTDPITGAVIPGIPVTGILDLPRSPQSESRSMMAYGYTAGLGVDFAVTSNVFLRAEWEYVQFLPVNNIRVNMNSGHVGVGVKF